MIYKDLNTIPFVNQEDEAEPTEESEETKEEGGEEEGGEEGLTE
jgi:hypothetical protein